jgi:hypothetical protein
VQTGQTVTASSDADMAPTVEADALYTVTLAPRASVSFAHTPGKVFGDGAAGTTGLLRFHAAQAGLHRITLDAGMWVDVVNAGQLVDSTAFRGRQPCGPIHKSVEVSLPAGDRSDRADLRTGNGAGPHDDHIGETVGASGDCASVAPAPSW